MATSHTGTLMYDMSLFYSKRVVDYNDAQRMDNGFTETAPFVGLHDSGVDATGAGPIGWDSVQPVLQQRIHEQYGTVVLNTLQKSYNATSKWIAFLEYNVSTKLIENGLSDWMNVEPSNVKELTGHVFVWMNFKAWSYINTALGKESVARQYETKADTIKKGINDKFLNAKTGLYNSPTGTFSLTQCSQSLPLYHRLVPNASVPNASAQLTAAMHEKIAAPSSFEVSSILLQPHMAVGMFCVESLLMSLDVNLAYQVTTTTSYPSYGYMLTHNATTLWESWFFSNNTYSHNHPMFSGIGVWFFNKLGGINQQKYSKSWSHIVLRPRSPCGMDSHVSDNDNGSVLVLVLPGVRVMLDTVRGRIESNWTRLNVPAGNNDVPRFDWAYQIPFGSVGFIDLPGKELYRVDGGERNVLKNVDLCET